MAISEIKKVGIVGAGTMGAGIAQVAALSGLEVIIFDLASEALKNGENQIKRNLTKGVEKGKLTEEESEKAIKRIVFTHSIRDLICDIIIEAVVEKLDVKIDILKQLETQNDEKCILATNTSSIPITKIASGLSRPEYLVGMHFFNPAHIMKLVEIIKGADTKEIVVEVVKNLSLSMGKTPVMVSDSPGFVVNRVARHFYVESLKILEEGVADLESIDHLLESFGFKMGPFKLMDLIGVDTNHSVTQRMYESFYYDPKFRPSRIQQQKVDAGHLGRKTGKGFYEY
ncbi:3-hydroxybutyryl-CoA dehydrogenase [Hyphobacterium sp. CCMP332]|nr:3-hydroxybutyryl-CoA dehydrogenase [Hyphobacterium sp. CCMP332]